MMLIMSCSLLKEFEWHSYFLYLLFKGRNKLSSVQIGQRCAGCLDQRSVHGEHCNVDTIPIDTVTPYPPLQSQRYPVS